MNHLNYCYFKLNKEYNTENKEYLLYMFDSRSSSSSLYCCVYLLI